MTPCDTYIKKAESHNAKCPIEIIIIIIIHNLYSAALLKDPAALYNNDNINIKSVR